MAAAWSTRRRTFVEDEALGASGSGKGIDDVVEESDEGNNDCSDSVVVTTPPPGPGGNPLNPGPLAPPPPPPPPPPITDVGPGGPPGGAPPAPPQAPPAPPQVVCLLEAIFNSDPVVGLNGVTVLNCIEGNGAPALGASGTNPMEPEDMLDAVEAASQGNHVDILWLLKDNFYTFYLPSNPGVSTMQPVPAPVVGLTVILS